MTRDEIEAIDALMETTQQMIDLTYQKIESLHDMRKVLWACKQLEINPAVVGPVKFRAVSESTLSPERTGDMHIISEDAKVVLRLKEVPKEFWPESITTPHGVQPVRKSAVRPTPKSTHNE